MNSAEETDDEDVILPNSPLYQYFYESNDIECHENHSETRDCKSVNSSQHLKTLCKISPLTLFRTLYNKIKIYASTSQAKRCQRYLQILIDKKLIIAEDHFFLESCFGDLHVQSNVQNYPQRLILFSSILLVLMSSCLHLGLVPEIFAFSILSNSTILIIQALVLLCFSCSLFFVCYFYYLSLAMDRKMKEVCTNIKQVIEYLKKTYKMIQETELIARGFASASGITVAERLELSKLLPTDFKNRQLPELRKSLFMWIRELYIQYRQATCDIIAVMPLRSELPSQYFATMPLEQFGILLKFDPDTSEGFKKLLEVSDTLSLSSLKSLFELFTVQVSEFFKRFCLTFLHLKVSDSVLDQTVDLHFQEYIDILAKINHHDQSLLHLIKESYVLTRNMNNIQECPHEKPVNINQASSIQKYNVLIHDLQLHLRATLMKVLELEDKSAANQDSNLENSEGQVKSYFTEQLNYLKVICADLESSKDCLLNCFSFAEEKTCSKPIKTTDTVSPSPVVQPAIKSNFEIIPDCEPVIEDEVYEAVIEHLNDEKNNESVDAYPDKSIVDRKVSANLLCELKKVLISKAEEHKCRELKAIKAKAAREKNCATAVDNCPLTDSTTHLNNVCDNPNLPSATVDTARTEQFTETSSSQNGYELNEISDDLIPEDAAIQVDERFTKFEKPPGNDFSASIAAMASQRRKQLDLTENIYEFSDYDNCDEELDE